MHLENGLFFPVISANLTQSYFCRSSQLQLHRRCSNGVQFQVFKKTEKNQYFSGGAGGTVESRAPLSTLLAFSEAGGSKAQRSRAQDLHRSLQTANQRLHCCGRIPALPHLEHLQLTALHLFLKNGLATGAQLPCQPRTSWPFHCISSAQGFTSKGCKSKPRAARCQQASLLPPSRGPNVPPRAVTLNIQPARTCEQQIPARACRAARQLRYRTATSHIAAIISMYQLYLALIFPLVCLFVY